MNYIQCDKTNMACIILGKKVYTPLRGQPNVIIQIPFTEWLAFISENHTLLDRQPLRYKMMLEEDNPLRTYKFFMFECSWVLYNEMTISAREGLDSTIILPYFEKGTSLEFSLIKKEVSLFRKEDMELYYNKLLRTSPSSYNVSLDSLSKWNMDILLLCIYLQSKAKAKEVQEINIDWR